jgi:hypothetical protein
LKHKFDRKRNIVDVSKYLITDTVVNNSSAVDDVFLNRFDITWATDSRFNKTKTMTLNPIEPSTLDGNNLDDGSITYNYNNEWFRSDDFTENHATKYHILFAGCSETEGVGGNIETIWSNMLYESLKDKYDIDGFYSIARAGFGWQKIITNFMLYEKKYGAPTHFFVLMPNIDRMFAWMDSESLWRYIQKFPFDAGMPAENAEINNFPTENEHMKMLIDFTISWKLFEKYCQSIGTKILWSTWDFMENPNLMFFNQHESFFKIDVTGKFNDYIKLKRPDGKLESDDMDRRDGHSGKLFHMFWKESFMDEIEKRGMFND